MKFDPSWDAAGECRVADDAVEVGENDTADLKSTGEDQ
jgi:hypothetical protein